MLRRGLPNLRANQHRSMGRVSAASIWFAEHGLRISVVAAATVFVVGTAIALLLPSAELGRIKGTSGPYDVTIFRCAAQLIGHADPYRLEPLATCERQNPIFPKDAIAPAPQPGYLLLALAPFARLDLVRFSFVWTVTSVASFILAAGLLARVTGLHGGLIFGCIALGPGFENLTLGQLSAPVLLGTAASCYALRCGRLQLAALALAPALTEPHVALPAYLALFVLVPRARFAIALVAATAIALSIVATGASAVWEYVRIVLPLQALSEIPYADAQYSLTTLVAALGASDAVAVRIGEIQYAVFAIGGIVLAKRLQTRFDDPTFVVALPIAIAVIGGPFVHYSETLAMLPALLLLLHYATGTQRIVATAALALYAVPWHIGGGVRFGTFSSLVVGAVVGMLLAGLERRLRLGLWAAITLPILGYFVFIHRIPNRVIGAIATSRDAFLSETTWAHSFPGFIWGLSIRADYTTFTSFGVLAKIPTFVDYVLFAALIAMELRARSAARSNIAR
jgi:Glycosyltransferase family 87